MNYETGYLLFDSEENYNTDETSFWISLFNNNTVGQNDDEPTKPKKRKLYSLIDVYFKTFFNKVHSVTYMIHNLFFFHLDESNNTSVHSTFFKIENTYIQVCY